MPTFNILSIDGGGLRGIIPIRILQKVEAITGKKIHQTFDMMAGTSTGGLIAACLTLRDEVDPMKPKYSLEQISDIYTTKGETIFPIRSGISRFLRKAYNIYRPAFSDSGIDKVLKQYVQGQRVKDALRPILISTYDLQDNVPVFFKSAEANGDEGANAKIYDVCRATSAAPTYLPSYSFTYKNKKLTGIDGGVFVNNPAMAALAEVSKYGRAGFYKKRDGSPVEFTDIRILSLGTGTYTGTIAQDKTVNWGEAQWITRITDIMMKGVNLTTHFESAEMLDTPNYVRLNINIHEEDFSDMSDARPATRNYLEQEVKNQVLNAPQMMTILTNFLNSIS